MTQNLSSSPASDFAVALLEELLRLGLRDVVLSPGSRSQALALALAEYESLGRLRLRVRIDERAAGFLALGLAVETGAPVLVVTTSGTAVANLHPAVLEAHHAGVPLIVLSADRPAELRGIGSNQTAQQPGLFGEAITRSWDVAAPRGEEGEAEAAALVARQVWSAASVGRAGRAGPAHLNLAFTEPLSGPVDLPDDGAPHPVPSVERGVPEPVEVTVLRARPGTVVIAGSGAGEVAESTARALGAPLFAEVASGARFGPNLVVMYRELLNSVDFGGAIERVIVFGHPTLSREVPALIVRDGVSTIVVRSPGADDYNPGRRVSVFVDAVRVDGGADDSPAERSWLGRWVGASRALLEPEEPETAVTLGNAAFARRQLAIVRQPVSRRMLVEALWQATWPHDRLVLGASRLIREADRTVGGKRIRVHANRGLAGIDGTIATAIGIALASQSEKPGAVGAVGSTRVLLGDLAALHDAGSLLFGVGEARPRIQLIVGNDGGGTIFDGLEVAAHGPSAAFDRVMFTQQTVDFEKLAAAYGWAYLRVATRGELDTALSAVGGPTLIEVPLAR